MKLSFNTIKRPYSDNEKRSFAEAYEEGTGIPLDIDDYFAPLFEEILISKCLNCGFEQEDDFDIVSECWDRSFSDYPIAYCPTCNLPQLVPIDVYFQIIKK